MSTKGSSLDHCSDNNNTDKVPPGKGAAFVAIGDDEDEGIYDTCFMMKETVLFSLTEASRSIFGNSDLLSDIQSEDPFFIGRIDGTSKGFKVSKSGDFGGLGRVTFS